MGRQYTETSWVTWVDGDTVIAGFDHDDVGDCACPASLVDVMVEYAPRGVRGWTVADATRVADACSEAYSSGDGQASGYRNMGEQYVVEHHLSAFNDPVMRLDYERIGRRVAARDIENRVAIWHSCGACRMLHRFNYGDVTRRS